MVRRVVPGGMSVEKETLVTRARLQMVSVEAAVLLEAGLWAHFGTLETETAEH